MRCIRGVKGFLSRLIYFASSAQLQVLKFATVLHLVFSALMAIAVSTRVKMSNAYRILTS